MKDYKYTKIIEGDTIYHRFEKIEKLPFAMKPIDGYYNEWLGKCFKESPKLYMYESKYDGKKYTEQQVKNKYKKAMNIK